MKNNEYCPVLLTKNPAPIDQERYWCKKSRCAWWMGNRCAVASIAEAFEHVKNIMDGDSGKTYGGFYDA